MAKDPEKSRHASRRPRWTPEQLEALRVNYPHFPTFLVAQLCGHSMSSTYRQASALGLFKTAQFLASEHSGRVGKGKRISPQTEFRKGMTPANKGTRRPGFSPGRMGTTQFKKGRAASDARNYVPIGAEKVRDGYLARKVTDDPSIVPAQRWVYVHRMVWEAVHGQVPARHVVAFLPGRHTTARDRITPDALELISRSELMRRNSIHARYPELVPLVLLKAKLQRKINRRSQT